MPCDCNYSYTDYLGRTFFGTLETWVNAKGEEAQSLNAPYLEYCEGCGNNHSDEEWRKALGVGYDVDLSDQACLLELIPILSQPESRELH